MHLAGELVLGGVHERLAEAGRAAVVDLEDGVAAVGQQLRLRVVAPRVARPRAAVDHQHRRQVARIDVERQREVAVQRQAVARGDRDRFHRREGGRVEPGARAVEELGLAGLAVEEVCRTGVAVVVERDDERGLLRVLTADAGVARVQRAHPLPVAGEALVERVQHHPVAQVEGPEQLAGEVADHRTGEVDLVVAVDLALGPVGRVELDQPQQVAAAGAPHPDARAVGREGEGIAPVLVGVLGHHPQLAGLVVAHQQLVVARRGLRPGGPQAALAVGGPADDVARVAADQLEAAGGERHAIGVEEAAIAQVHRHQHVARRGPRGVDQAGAHARERGEVAGRPAAGRVDREQVVVLVAAEVLAVEDARRVARPHVRADAPVAVVGDRHGLAAGAVAHPDVEHAVAGRHPRQPGAVGGEPRQRALGVVEQVAERDEGRHAGHRRTSHPSRAVTLPASTPAASVAS